jgi:hypothetical protein
MKKTITLLAFCLIGTLSFAQAPAIQWQKCLGGTFSEGAKNIQPTSDGGYIVAGSTSSNDGDVTGNHGNGDAWVVKLSSTGSLQWQKALGGTGQDIASSIQPTADGGCIVAGQTTSNDGDVTANHGGTDAWVVKLSSTGSLQWQKCLGGTSGDFAESIQPTLDGGYIMAGVTYSNDGDVTGINGNDDAWVVKLSATGTIVWQKTLGGTGVDDASSIQPTPDGGYILVGRTNSTDGDVTWNHGNFDTWILKLSATGALVWQNALGGTGEENANIIQPTPDGGYIVGCFTGSNNGDVTGNHGGLDAWVVKISDMGVIEWQKTLGGTDTEDSFSIQPTTDGNYIVAGFTYSINGDVTGNHGVYDAWVVKLSSTGSLKWQKCLGGTNGDVANSIQPTPDGGFIVAGYTQSTNGDVTGNHGQDDAWVVKLGPELATSTFNNQALTLYPNPTNGLLQLQTPNNTSFNKIIITDSTGKTVLEQMQNTTQVDVEQLASGLYIIKAFSGEEVFVNKFIKE